MNTTSSFFILLKWLINKILAIYGKLKSYIYDMILVSYTSSMNRYFLKSIPIGSQILDIGIGTGKAMTNNGDIIKEKNLKIIGYDIDPYYIEQCRNHIVTQKLENYIQVKLKDIYKEDSDLKVDYVIFSDSYAVIPDVDKMINYCCRFLKDDGCIIVLTTLDDTNWLLNYKKIIKPKIKYFTTLEFGKVTTVDKFRKNILDNNLQIKKIDKIYDKWYFGYGQVKSYMINIIDKID